MSCMTLPVSCVSDISMAVRCLSPSLSPPTFCPGLQLLAGSLLQYHKFYFQLPLLVPATVVFNIFYSLNPSLTLPLPSIIFFLFLINFCMLPMMYLKYPSNHRVITCRSQLCFFLQWMPCTAEEVCECLCTWARASVSIIIPECRETQEILHPDSYGLMLAFFL